MWTKSPGAVILACALLAACDESPTSPDDVGPVAAVALVNGIQLTNGGDVPLAIATIDRRSLALLAPCLDSSPSCVRLPARGALFVPYRDVLFFTSDTTEVAVHSWRVVPNASGGYQASDFQSVYVNITR